MYAVAWASFWPLYECLLWVTLSPLRKNQNKQLLCRQPQRKWRWIPNAMRRGWRWNEIPKCCLHWGLIEFRWLESVSPRASCQWRICCLLICVCCRANWWTSGVLLWRMFVCLPCCGGTGRWHTSYFKGKVWGRNEDWCVKMARQLVAHSIHILSFTHTWHLCACLYVYINICMIQGATHIHVRVCVCGFLCY